MRRLDKKKMQAGVAVFDPAERIGVLVAYRDNKKAKLLSQRLVAPYAQSLRSSSPATFKRMESIENQVLAEAVWLKAWYLNDEGYRLSEEEMVPEDQLDDYWVEGAIIDESDNVIPAETVQEKYDILSDDQYVALKDVIEGIMRDQSRFVINPEEAGEEAGKH